MPLTSASARAPGSRRGSLQGGFAFQRQDSKAHSFKGTILLEASKCTGRSHPLTCRAVEKNRYHDSRQEYVLTDRGWLAEDIVAGLPLDERQRQYLCAIKESILEPAFRAGRTAAAAVVDNTHAAGSRCIAAQRRVDELRDQ